MDTLDQMILEELEEGELMGAETIEQQGQFFEEHLKGLELILLEEDQKLDENMENLALLSFKNLRKQKHYLWNQIKFLEQYLVKGGQNTQNKVLLLWRCGYS